MHIERLIDIAQKGAMLDEDRFVLKALLKTAYDAQGKPRGKLGCRSSETLAGSLVTFLHADNDEAAGGYEAKRRLQNAKRRLRASVNRLIIKHSIPIICLAGTGGGYYIPAGEEEVEQQYRTFQARAMTGLMKASRGRKAALSSAAIQLVMGFDGPDAAAIRHKLGLPAEEETDKPTVSFTVLTGILDQYRLHPEKFKDQLRALQEEYGEVLVARPKLQELKKAAVTLNKMLESL